MGKKGDRASKEHLARKLYADGYTLDAIGRQLDISGTSLSRWKKESQVPGRDLDEWDRARTQKQSNIRRLKDLFEDQLQFMEGLTARERTASMMDTLSKMGALLEKWDKFEKAQRVADEVEKVVRKAGLTDETAATIRASILGINKE